MYPTNEWSQLKKVVVGIADGAQVPAVDVSLRTVNYADVLDDANIPVGPYPQQVIDEANEDLNTFVKFLEGEGVEVSRPMKTKCEYYNYCPRDTVFVHGDLALATPTPLHARRNEHHAFSYQLSKLKNHARPHSKHLYNLNCVGNKDVLALTETSAAFDAANAIRANDDILYLVSNSGNRAGAELLQELVDPGVRVHTLEGVYSYMHIDSTVVFLREGLMLLNPERIKSKDVLPAPFCHWDAIWCPEPVDIGYYPGYCNASEWINMNMFSVSENLVALEENQEPLQRELEKYGIDSAMLPMRHQRTLGGGFHCVTLDTERS